MQKSNRKKQKKRTDEKILNDTKFVKNNGNQIVTHVKKSPIAIKKSDKFHLDQIKTEQTSLMKSSFFFIVYNFPSNVIYIKI